MFHPRGPTFVELIRQALTSTEGGYDLLAKKFDYTPFRTPDAILDAVAPLIGGRGSVGRALDLCCGTGAGMRVLRPLCRQCVVGLDVSRGMLAEARERLEDAPGTAQVAFVRSDALAVPFERAFDVVTCFGAFGHILREDEPRFVRSVARALVPGGRFVFVTAEPPSPLSARHWIARSFNAVMHVRNALWTPPFIMYYLTFLLPEARRLLERRGFSVEAHRGLLPPPFEHGVAVVATLDHGAMAGQARAR